MPGSDNDRPILDEILFPRVFSTLSLPEPLINFFTSKGIDFRNAPSFPMQILRDLYKEDAKTFETVSFLLSAYGCNFHSRRKNSFFPCDVAESEAVFSYLGASDDCFSYADMSKYGVWNFCQNASSSKCCFLNGVVVSRFTTLTGADANRILGYPLLTMKKVQMFSKKDPGSTGDDASTDSSSESSESDQTVEGEDPFVKPIPPKPKKPALPPIDAKLYLNDPNEVPESHLRDVKKAFVAPVFWLRFASTFFSMNVRAKAVYESCGFYTFEKLLKLSADNIKEIVGGLNSEVDDLCLRGIYINSLICYCKDRESFLKCFGENHSLRELLTLSDFTKDCIAQRADDFYVIDLDKHPLLEKPFNDCCDKCPGIDNFIRKYFEIFGVSDLSFVGDGLLGHSLRDYALKSDFAPLAASLVPFNIIDDVCRGAMGKAPLVYHGYDREIETFKTKELIDDYSSYVRNILSLNKRDLDILCLRERTKATLEEIAKTQEITRERIRQIQSKSAKRTAGPAKKLLDFLFLSYDIIPSSLLLSGPGLRSYAESEDSKYCVVDDLGVAVNQMKKDVVNKVKGDIADTNGPQYCEALDAFFLQNGFSLYPWLFENSYKFGFDPYPKYTFNKVSLADVGRDYLLSKGTRGFYLKEDENDLRKFFLERAPQSRFSEYRALCTDVIRSGAVLRNISAYISPTLVTEEQKQIVKEILDGTTIGQYGITGQSLFEKYQERFLACGIDNGYFAYGIAAYFYPNDYTYGGRSLRIFPGNELSLIDIAEGYLSERNPSIVPKSTFLTDLHLRESALQQITNVTNYDDSTLALKSWFSCSEQEFSDLSLFIDETIERQGFCHGFDVLTSQFYFNPAKNDFLKRNQIGNSPKRLVYFLDVIAERFSVTKYHFSHHCDCVSSPADPVEVKADIVNVHFKGKSFTIKELMSFFAKYRMTGAMDADSIGEIAYLVSHKSYALKRDIIIPSETIKDTSDALMSAYGGDIFILSSHGLNRLKAQGFQETFHDRPIEMASLLSESPESDWCCPKNDLEIPSNYNRTILANKRMLGSDPTYSELIRAYVKAAHPGESASLQELKKELLEAEVVDNYVNVSILETALSSWFDGLLVEVPE